MLPQQGGERRLYAWDSLGADLNTTVYALGSTSIDLCLPVFPWAHFRSTKAAVKMHTLLDLRGSIPSFFHISGGRLHDVHALDMLLQEAAAIYAMDRGYVDFFRLHILMDVRGILAGHDVLRGGAASRHLPGRRRPPPVVTALPGHQAGYSAATGFVVVPRDGVPGALAAPGVVIRPSGRCDRLAVR